jgi:hypothetical protein
LFLPLESTALNSITMALADQRLVGWVNLVFGGVLAHEEFVGVRQLDVGGRDDAAFLVAGVLDSDAGDFFERRLLNLTGILAPLRPR